MGSVTPERPDAVIADRNGITETTHLIHAAVVSAQDSTSSSNPALLFALGDPSRVTLIRSSAKPAQAVAVLETGAGEAYEYSDADLALMCASHNSEERHLARARDMLRRAGVQEEDIRCGGHPSISPDVTARWAKEGIVPTAVYNNCSGKHAGMLGAAKVLGAGVEGYHTLEHPVQQRVRNVVEEIVVSPDGESDVLWAVDGCNLPTPAARLDAMAVMYARFALAADEPNAAAPRTEGRGAVMGRVFRAMTACPEMVGGEKRFCTDFMRAMGGRAFGKVGADGFYGIGVRDCARTRELGARGGLGIAIKVEDGNMEVLYAAVVEILRQLGLISPEEVQLLAAYHHIERRNTADVVVGKLSFGFKVRPVVLQGP